MWKTAFKKLKGVWSALNRLFFTIFRAIFHKFFWFILEYLVSNHKEGDTRSIFNAGLTNETAFVVANYTDMVLLLAYALCQLECFLPHNIWGMALVSSITSRWFTATVEVKYLLLLPSYMISSVVTLRHTTLMSNRSMYSKSL